MGSATPLKERLANFLLMYRSIPHATTGMRPDELHNLEEEGTNSFFIAVTKPSIRRGEAAVKTESSS